MKVPLLRLYRSTCQKYGTETVVVGRLQLYTSLVVRIETSKGAADSVDLREGVLIESRYAARTRDL